MDFKELIKFGLEESSEPIIKNPVLRNAMAGGGTPQLVQPSVDGLRPGYAGEEETATYKYEDSRLRYNKKTKKWEMIAGRDQELYIQKPGETKPQFKKRVKKVGIDRRTKAHSLQSKQTKTSQNYINNWTKDWLDNNLKNYGVRDFDKAMKAMGKEWQANIKNLDLPQGTLKSLSRGEFNLPNVSTGRVGVHGKKPFTYEGFNLHTMFENPKEPGKYIAQWKKMFMKNKIRTTPGLKKDILEYFKFINKDKRGKVWRQEGTVKAFKDIMNKDVIYLMSPDSGITGHGKESLFNSFDDAFNKEYNKYAKKINLGSNWKEAAAKIEKQLGYEPGHILKSMSKERKALNKLFNLKELPHELRYSLEHGQGIAAAAKTNNPVIMQRAMDDLIGTTVRQNKTLGWGGFEATRNALMRDIMAGNNVTDNIKSLNELSRGAYKDFGLKGKMYSMKDGQLTSKPISTALTQEDRFAQYFKEINKTKEGRAAIKKQHGNLKNLLVKLGCGMYAGGRVGFKVGSGKCVNRAVAKLKSGKLNASEKKIVDAMGDGLKKIGGKGGMPKGFWTTALKGEGYFALADFANNLTKGQSLDKSFSNAIKTATFGLADFKGNERDLLKYAKERGLDTEAVKQWMDYGKTYGKYEKGYDDLEEREKMVELSGGEEEFWKNFEPNVITNPSGNILGTENLWDAEDRIKKYDKQLTEKEKQESIYSGKGSKDFNEATEGVIAKEWNKFAGTPLDIGFRKMVGMKGGEGGIWGILGALSREAGEQLGLGEHDALKGFKPQIVMNYHPVYGYKEDIKKAMRDGDVPMEDMLEFMKKYYPNSGLLEEVMRGRENLQESEGYDQTGWGLMKSPQQVDMGTYEFDPNLGYNYAGGGIAGIRRPSAIPPESGPTPYGLPSMLNRVKRV